MAPAELPSLVQVLAGAVLLYVIYYIHWQLTVGASRRALIKQYGCKPLNESSELNSFPNNFFGIKAVRENLKAVKEHRMLDLSRARFLRNGRTFRLKIFSTDFVQTIEPDNLKTIMSLKFKEWSLPDRRKAAFVPLLGHGIFTTDGAAWQHSRELLRPNFVRSQVGDLDTFERHVAMMIKAIPRDGSTVDLQTLFFELTIDTASEFLFGESTDCLASGSDTNADAPRFAQAFNRSQELIADTFRSGWIAQWRKRKQFTSDVDFVHKYVDRFVQRGLKYRKTLDLEKVDAKAEDRYVFLYELVKRTGDPVQIRAELLNVLLAGRDTTASLLSAVFFVLARRPDIWAKLRAEVDQLQGEKPTFQQIKDMKYLRAILNESLRLYPIVPGNSRMAIVDTVLPLGGGPDGKSPLFIPAKQIVQWSAYTMHRRFDYYGDDALEFKPERWEKLRPGWEYLPFNGGPRICIGQQFALTEASYTTIRLLQQFQSIEAREPMPWQEQITLTCSIHQGTQVGLVPA